MKAPTKVIADLGHPFALAFTATIGVLVAIALGTAFASLSTVLFSVGVALFIALALSPLILKLEARGIAIVLSGFAAVIAAIGAFLVPSAINQVVKFSQAVPGYLADLQQSAWFQSVVAGSDGSVAMTSVLGQLQAWHSDPSILLSLGSGAITLGAGIINGVSATIIVIVLTLYLLASLDSMKAALYRLAPAHSRPTFADVTEQITSSIGGFISGGVTLASTNALFFFILLALLGVSYAAMLGLFALLVTLIPLIRSVVFWVVASLVAALYSLPTAVGNAVIYFIYMQVEAYWLTPRILNRAVAVPGSLVLIGAMVGATLLGLLGALLAVPVTASILLIIRSVFVPRQDAKVFADAFRAGGSSHAG